MKRDEHSASTQGHVARSAHTPGPWIAQRPSAHRVMHVTAGHFQVFLGTHTGASVEEWDANARLIAAAPRMYEWLIAHYAIEEGPGRTDRPQYAELKSILDSISA